MTVRTTTSNFYRPGKPGRRRAAGLRRLLTPGGLAGLLVAVLVAAGFGAAAQKQPPAFLREPTWTADNGNGTFSNPLFYDEFSDPDLIRVGTDYYLTGTTMHAMPGLPVLHSKDLVNWEFLTYAAGTLDFGPAYRLEQGQNIYGQGIWAPCLRYHNGTFYIFTNVNGRKTQLYTATDPKGPWAHTELKRSFHDLSVLFDDDGKVHVVWGYEDLHLAELTDDLTDIRPGSEQLIAAKGSGAGEGSHFYKIDGTYYLTNTLYDPLCYQVCLRATHPRGPYEVQVISAEENQGFGTGYQLVGGQRQPPSRLVPPVPNLVRSVTLHQGGLVQTPAGEWWGWSMMDHNAVGRLTCLSPVTWQNGWPYFGLPGNLTRSPVTWLKPTTGVTATPHAPYRRSDDFAAAALQPVWQWNHAPVAGQWSLAEHRGYLRLHALPAPDFWQARNTLTQRAIGPESVVTTEVDLRGLQAGDVAGLALLNWPYAWLGVAATATGRELRHYDHATGQTSRQPLAASRLWLRVSCNFDTEKARFSYSSDGQTFAGLGPEGTMVFQLRTFQGVRYGLFNFNTEGRAGGYADFNSFAVAEPRPHGLARPIPYGQQIRLTSRADSTVLVSWKNLLRPVPARDQLATQGPASCFRVVERGLGRVALQSVATGYWVTVRSLGGLAEVRLEATEQGEASLFQWQDMQHGDLMLQSLRTHRYLFADPGAGSLCSADAPGTRPDHRDGACFGWEVQP